ncbi:MAG: VWA domain-containing protein, partial [Bifidobacteriaceae bacterium]|nr:VWA domain-containing protein [Bifidobacteriaceae bacterium]
MLIYWWLGLAAAAGLAGVAALAWRRAAQRSPGGPGGGTRLANTLRVAHLPAFLAAARRHNAAAAAGLVCALVAGLGAALVAARPARADLVSPEARSRDVVLCLDVSGSMYPVDAGILEQFREIVRGFDGERVAMSWFNSSSVTLFPLTDDYEFIEETLAPIQKQFETVADPWGGDWWDLSGDRYPDDTGTLLGEGSSLPGDGLAACLQLFDNKNQDRPRSVILATDNMVEGVPIFELGEAAALASAAGVRVYALCPEEVYDIELGLFGGPYGDPAAFDELRREVESTGGAYYDTTGSESIQRILQSILAEEAELLEAAEPVRVVADRPLVGLALLWAGLAGVALWGGWRAGRRLAAGRRAALLALAGLIALNPALGSEQYRQVAVDADVIALVDTSPSIAAEDWDGGQPRLDGVKADLAAIAAHHAGAHIAIVAFDATARLELPLTTDAGAVQAAADTLAPVSTFYASGSSIDSGLDLLAELLRRSEANHPERARLVYYLGDGEQTSDQAINSFAAMAPLVDGGAVLGYGTAGGGQMKEFALNGWGVWFDEPAEADYILGPDGLPGVSKIDEANLKAIAEELGVGYALRAAGSPVEPALWSGALPERTLDRDTSASRPLGPWLAVVAAALLAWEIWVLVPRQRRAAAALRLAAAVAAARPGGGGGEPGGAGAAGGWPGSGSA